MRVKYAHLQRTDGLLAEEVKRLYWARWNEENKDGIAAYNTRIAKEGLPLANPLFELDGVKFVLDTAALAAFPVTELRTPVTNLQFHSDAIVDALDTLFGS